MQQPVTKKPRPQGKRQKKGCCTDLECESGLRNHYYEGKRLTPDMFRVEQDYFVERRRLLNRALYGSGVVYGYGLRTGKLKEGAGGQLVGSLRVLPGLAFDSCGRELLQVGDLKLDLDDLIVLDADGKELDAEEAFGQAGASDSRKRHKDEDDDQVCWLLSVHYAEQRDGHVTVPDPCECDRHEWDRVCETVRYSLRRILCDDCCEDDDCGLDCGCGTGHCCDPKRRNKHKPPKYERPEEEPPAREPYPHGQRLGAVNDGRATNGTTGTIEATETPERVPPPFRRGGCRCLCDHGIGLDVDATCTTRLVEIKEACGNVYVDLTHGVKIACIGLISDMCGGWTFGETVDTCGPRRTIKRNDLLFDLIRGCDLTRLSKVSWYPWHRHRDHVSFKDFKEAFGAVGQDPLEYETTFSVTFSRPVQKRTVKPDCFAMTVISFEPADRGWQTLRVPIVRVITSDVTEADDPDDTVRSARLVVGTAWVEDGLGGYGGPFNGPTWVEIEVRGDFILDCNGQPVDANAVGRRATPTGNGTPGGTFLSTFCVKPRPAPQRGARYNQSEGKGASS